MQLMPTEGKITICEIELGAVLKMLSEYYKGGVNPHKEGELREEVAYLKAENERLEGRVNELCDAIGKAGWQIMRDGEPVSKDALSSAPKPKQAAFREQRQTTPFPPSYYTNFVKEESD